MHTTIRNERAVNLYELGMKVQKTRPHVTLRKYIAQQLQKQQAWIEHEFPPDTPSPMKGKFHCMTKANCNTAQPIQNPQGGEKRSIVKRI